MAVEAKRGCGFRKVGGLYLVGMMAGTTCDRLPFRLNVCPCCGEGIKQAMGWTWIDVPKLFGGKHQIKNPLNPDIPPKEYYCGKGAIMHMPYTCVLCKTPEVIGKAGLLWVGKKFYPTPIHFEMEAKTLGISKRIKGIPHGFELGKTWVMFAHPTAYVQFKTIVDVASGEKKKTIETAPAIFKAWLPQRLEKLFKESDKESDAVKKAVKHGITPVFVPDNDKDHQGSVYDKEEQLEFEGVISKHGISKSEIQKELDKILDEANEVFDNK